MRLLAWETWSETRWLAVILLAASLVTHFMWFGYPAEVVFDEVHFGKFVTAYCCTGERFFDIHPPHAKLLIAGAGKLLGYRGGFSFDHIGQAYDVPYIGLRVVPALSGTVLPLLFFILLLQLGASKAAAFFGGVTLVFDNSLTVQTRIIALDGLMLAAIIGSLILYLKAEKYVLEGQSGYRERRRWLWLTLGTGALAGLAVGAKYTGLAALALIGVIMVVRLIKSWRDHVRIKRWLATGLLVLGAAFVVYMAGWAMHFAILVNPGKGDAWGVPKFDKPLIVSFFRESFKLQKQMYNANNGLKATHHDASKWWTWPYMGKTVFYWNYSAPPGSGMSGSIYSWGNPAVWWGSTAILLVVLVWMAVEGASKMSLKHIGKAYLWIPLAGYLIAYIPLMSVRRVLFLYHYLTPLLFAIMISVLWLDYFKWFRPGSVRRQPKHYFVALGVVILIFVLFSPITYGFVIPSELYAKLFWFKEWH